MFSGKMAPSVVCRADSPTYLSIGCSAACGANKLHRPAIRVRPPQESGIEKHRIAVLFLVLLFYI